MPNVLVIDDEELVTSSVAAYLVADGMRADVAADARAGERSWREGRPDAVVLDVRLPGASGLDLLRRMRLDGDRTPVVLLSGLGSVDDRIVGLEVGADDYLAKPFSPRELVLRVAALLRRGDIQPGADSHPLTVGPLTLDPTLRTATLAGRSQTLAPREFDLLAFLARNAGVTFGSRELLRRVWGWDFGDDSTVVVHVRRLRRKFEPDPSAPVLLTTVRGTGYRLGTADELAAALAATA
ncbi:response regulator transcription factor [Cellulomonas sp. JH27-2]|uniref:response regulator transcription factor n=1 Tax=Cellulomonas sp. JH27-2 TaxID=2774139 RepID=UPI0017875D9E|nr:response regulator transcription factor [Cellulomonas sp. JH27-2]MBD8060067.1 response regulator transcription factor [Cellulomonas sp. JH27-2]